MLPRLGRLARPLSRATVRPFVCLPIKPTFRTYSDKPLGQPLGKDEKTPQSESTGEKPGESIADEAAKKTTEDLVKVEKKSSIFTDDMLANAGIDVEKLDEKPRKKSKRANKTTGDLKRERWANIFYVLLFTSLGGVGAYAVRNWDEGEDQHLKPGEEAIENGYTPSLMYRRFSKRWDNFFLLFTDPLEEKLLPDQIKESPNAPDRMTLVISLEDLLIHSEWDPEKGWRVAKRPGVDYFLLYLAPTFEIVLFLDNYYFYAERTVEKLDPSQMLISARLFREHARIQGDKVVKDLSLLNRDLGKVIILDTKEEHFLLQPENGILMKPWDGKPDDGLIKMIPFFDYLCYLGNIKDVRPILATFKDRSNIPEEFAVREKALREAWEKKVGLGSFINTILAKLMGMPQDSMKPKFFLDRVREVNQMNYRYNMKRLEESKEQLKAQNEALANQKFTLGEVVGSVVGNQEEISRKMQERMLEAEREARNAINAKKAGEGAVQTEK